MIRDHISHELQSTLHQIEDLNRQERTIKEARGLENRTTRDAADKQARKIREHLLTNPPPAATYKFLDATRTADAVKFRSIWQENNRIVDCFEDLVKHWKEGGAYYKDVFESPKLDLAILPPYSFVIQFLFTLVQPYISRDEQDFYIIDNPVRKDKVFGLPYIAPTSWKGSLRSALWRSGKKEEIDPIRHLFGNEKETNEQEDFRAGRLFFFPTFFTMKGLEIINPQDRQQRVGTLPIPFETVPRNTEGIFTLLYVPFDLIDEGEEETRKQVAEELLLVAEGIQKMFRTYGFGAKTSSGFGLAEEDVKGMLTLNMDHPQSFESFTALQKLAEKVAMTLNSREKKVHNG